MRSLLAAVVFLPGLPLVAQSSVAFASPAENDEVRVTASVQLTLRRVGRPALRVEAPILPGMAEDTVAAHLLDELVDAGARGVGVEAVDDGADRIRVQSGVINAVVSDGGAKAARVAVETVWSGANASFIDLKPRSGAHRVVWTVHSSWPAKGRADSGAKNGSAPKTTATAFVNQGTWTQQELQRLAKALRDDGLRASVVMGFVRVAPGPRGQSFASLSVRAEPLAKKDAAATVGIDLFPGGKAELMTPAQHDALGDLQLKAGQFEASIENFDRALASAPQNEPYHWRRGIAYYYAKRFGEGVKQFEVHRGVNPADVENAVWHFLCKARLDGLEAARESILPVGRDGREPMMTVYELFAGRATPADVLKRAQAAGESRQAESELFYAHLYLGLYHEALGDAKQAEHHIRLAAETYTSPHYMGDVARLHASLFDG